jgi:hypothetical protein
VRRLRVIRSRRRDDRGDSLIEVLFAVVLIALAAGPLIGALLESIAASSEHRGIATGDTLLKSFAETAKSEIETGSTPYQETTTPTYQLISNPSKPSGPATTTVTVFVTGFATTSFSVAVGSMPATLSNVTLYGSGNARITFLIPSGLASRGTPYPITVSNTAGKSATSLNGTGFKVTSLTPGTAKRTPYGKGYQIQVVSTKCWTTSGAGSFTACTTSNKTYGLQLLTFSARGPDGIIGNLAVVVRNPKRT